RYLFILVFRVRFCLDFCATTDPPIVPSKVPDVDTGSITAIGSSNTPSTLKRNLPDSSNSGQEISHHCSVFDIAQLELEFHPSHSTL
ncbi:hypothetical protein BDZ89DRAFT_823426, partial [Hymenopellis radicata]